jgi:hypothetical protein
MIDSLWASASRLSAAPVPKKALLTAVQREQLGLCLDLQIFFVPSPRPGKKVKKSFEKRTHFPAT